MVLPTYPTTDLDSPEHLLAQLGSFWSETYQGSLPVASIVSARGRLARQAANDVAELRSALAVHTVPTYHTRLWHPVKLLAAQKTGTASYPAPAGLAGVNVLCNRLTRPSRVLLRGLDFSLDPVNGLLTFTTDPFADELVGTLDILQDGTVLDRQALLWAYRASFDTRNLYLQFGHVLGLDLGSSPACKDLLNALYAAMTSGGVALAVDQVLASAAGVTLCRSNGEVVQQIVRDDRFLWIITAQNAYSHHVSANPTVAVDDVLRQGQSLTDTLRFLEFQRGEVPDPAILPALTVTAGLLADTGYAATGLTWANQTVPVTVVENDPSGFTRISWPLGGAAADVTKFWNDTHTAGVAAGATLAMALDLRSQRPLPAQPTAATLPGTMNPLAFLIQNVLRNHAYVALLRPAVFTPTALGLTWLATVLRQVVPAHTSCIVLSTA